MVRRGGCSAEIRSSFVSDGKRDGIRLNECEMHVLPLKRRYVVITGGNLYDKINQQKGELFTEEVCNTAEHYRITVCIVHL